MRRVNAATLTLVFCPLTAFEYLSVGILPCMLLRLYHHASTQLKGISEHTLPIDYSTLTLRLAETRLGPSNR